MYRQQAWKDLRVYGTSLWCLRQGAAVRKYHQSRPQREQTALECQSAAGSCQSWGVYEAHTRLYFVSSQRQSGQGVEIKSRKLPTMKMCKSGGL